VRKLPCKLLHIQKVAGIAGSENHLLILLPRLREHGYNPTMLVLADPQDRPEDFMARMRAEGVPTHLMRMKRDISLSLLLRLARFIRSQRFDLVHTHLFHADMYGAAASAFANGHRLISTQHGYAERRDYKWWVAAADRVASHRQDTIVTISESLRHWLHKTERLPLEKMITIHYGFDHLSIVREIHCGPSRKLSDILVIGTVGRLISFKQIDILIQAMPLVLQKFSNARLQIIGDGPQRPSLEVLARDLGLENNVEFLGNRYEASRLMTAFDIFAFPSIREGFGMVLLEAMAVCLPIVACRVSSIPEILVDGETGFLVPVKDSPAFAQAIIRLLSDPQLGCRMGQAGRKRLEINFSVEKMVKQTVKVYQQVLAAQ
jgi:glycosyltransferase involved in cell wall biosynthesis